jgi:uncharacterized membrane protein YagU involved in acid resistance
MSLAGSSLRWRWVLAGGVFVATLDALFATGFWYLRNAVPPVRILQSIAAGLLGEASFEGGAATAWLGAALHCAIAIVMVAVYALAARRWPRLTGHPWSSGLAYGALLYGAMTWVVVPLSAASPSPKVPAWIAASIAMHLFIGLLCAVFTRRAQRRNAA